jgi:hypothetical protein
MGACRAKKLTNAAKYKAQQTFFKEFIIFKRYDMFTAPFLFCCYCLTLNLPTTTIVAQPFLMFC